VRIDDDIVGGGIAGADGLDWLAKAAGEAGLVAEGADVAGAEAALEKRLGERLADLGLAVEVDEAEGSGLRGRTPHAPASAS
jgi:hypothetical protein